MKKLATILFFSALACFVRPVFASETNGTIKAPFRYAWGENLGWINFKPDTGGLTITDTVVTGYVWSQGWGWINFSPAGGGVTNNSSGQLGGYAWSSHKGWLPLAGVTIDASGRFVGTTGITSSTAGRIKFDCANCAVHTDWRPVAARTVVTTPAANTGATVGSGGSISLPTAPAGQHVDSFKVPFTIAPNEPGILSEQTTVGTIVLEIPPNTLVSQTTFNIDEQPVTSVDSPAILFGSTLINGAFFNITAVDSNGQTVHSFNFPLTITLPLPANLAGLTNLGVYWLDETTQQWIPIPGATFASNKVIFTVNHLTKFAIFSVPVPPAALITPTGSNTTVSARNSNPTLSSITTTEPDTPTRALALFDVSSQIFGAQAQSKNIRLLLLLVFIAGLLAGLFYKLYRYRRRVKIAKINQFENISSEPQNIPSAKKSPEGEPKKLL